MKPYWGVEVELHAFLTLALYGGEWSASRPGLFTPRERSPSTHCIGGPQSRPGVGGEEKNSQTLPGPEPLIIQPIAQRYTTELTYRMKSENFETKLCLWSLLLSSRKCLKIKSNCILDPRTSLI
jgi:hypothetical protein